MKAFDNPSADRARSAIGAVAAIRPATRSTTASDNPIDRAREVK